MKPTCCTYTDDQHACCFGIVFRVSNMDLRWSVSCVNRDTFWVDVSVLF